MKVYIPVKIKLFLALAFACLWLGISLYLALPWIFELGELLHPFLAWFIVSGIALIPGFCMAFVYMSLSFDKRPQYGHVALPPISILVAAYNEEATMEHTLEFISRQSYPADVEVVVIDDGSTDGTAQKARDYIESYDGPYAIRLEQLEHNQGKAAALNRGMDVCAHEVLVTIDADTVLYGDALINLVTNLVAGPEKTAAVAGTILVRNSRKSIVTKMQEWDYFLGIAVIKRVQSLFQGTLVAQGAFSAYYKTPVSDVGGWAHLVGEDIVLTWALREKGYRVAYAENAFAFTNTPETYGAFFRQRKRWSRGLIEAFKRHPKVITKVQMNSIFIWMNLLFPYTDLVYLFVFVPGIIAALFFEYYAIVGVMTLMLLPLALLGNSLMFYKQKRIFEAYGLKVRQNFRGLILYMFCYQIFMAPACLMGYFSEFFRSSKTW